MNWTVVSNVAETPTTRTLRFHPEKPVSFKPGQFFLFYDLVAGFEECRAYSASSSPLRDYVEITVKLVGDPVFSKHLQNLSKGYSLDCKGPFGKFFFEKTLSDVVLIGAGSGIAPLHSILQYVQDTKSSTKITLIYSSKTAELIIFRTELAELAAQNKIKLVFTLTQEKKAAQMREGRITAQLLNETIANVKNPIYFICGPPTMVKTTHKILVDLGVQNSHINLEQFS